MSELAMMLSEYVDECHPLIPSNVVTRWSRRAQTVWWMVVGATVLAYRAADPN
jgi:hypothetical protein